ncbi:histone acetyltransferase type B subunit 2 [[Candida] anglica]|uniref:Histone acetyltransferase type B subunit 2 n=1 Tax=[Candida] anglica TaxID=148631 RepID=A0ABP0EIS1_9ASCO
MSADQILEKLDEGAQELTIKEEYQLWRKNCRYMYQFVTETALTWPSLTVQWLPEHSIDEDTGAIDAKLLLGTHTSGEDKDFLKVASTQLPSSKSSGGNSRIKITKKFQNSSEINRARYMPQDPSTVATINGLGEVDLYRLDDDKKSSSVQFKPHTENGFGLAWSPHKKGHLLTASDDKTAVITDTSVKSSESIVVRSTSHTDVVNDAKFHPFDENLFGTVSDDKYTYIFDIRDGATKPVLSYYSEDSKGINSLAFSPFSHNLLATGNTNSNISMLDLRNMKLLHTLMGHSGSISSLEFSPHRDGILASGSEDRRLILWDLFKVGEEQAQEDAEDGCPELFMMHAGHTGAVMDLNWCPYRDWTLASVADDNIVHLWEVGKSILDDKVEVDEKELE